MGVELACLAAAWSAMVVALLRTRPAVAAQSVRPRSSK